MTTFTMPAGQYYFGDPCYVINEGWLPLLNDTDYLEDFSTTERVLRAGSTAHGDGLYGGMGILRNNMFAVDSGSLGFVPVDEMEVSTLDAERMGTLVSMQEPFTFGVERGVYYVNGNVVVYTDHEDYY